MLQAMAACSPKASRGILAFKEKLPSLINLMDAHAITAISRRSKDTSLINSLDIVESYVTYDDCFGRFSFLYDVCKKGPVRNMKNSTVRLTTPHWQTYRLCTRPDTYRCVLKLPDVPEISQPEWLWP